MIHTQGSIHFWYPPHTHLQEYFLGASPPYPHVFTHWPSLHFDFEGAVCAGTEDALCRQGGMASRGRVQQQQMPPQPWTSLQDVLPCLLLARFNRDCLVPGTFLCLHITLVSYPCWALFVIPYSALHNYMLVGGGCKSSAGSAGLSSQ